MCVTTGANSGKAENLFPAIDSAVKNDDINWDNQVSIGLDNTNSNMGNRNSIKSRILEKARICGWLKLPFIPPSSSFWRTSLSGDSGLWHGDHQIDMYYFFKNSTWRKGTLLECLEFMVQEWDNMSRFVKIRWLSLETCCNKEFKNFPSLKPIFLSRTDNSLGNDEIRAATKEGKNRIR